MSTAGNTTPRTWSGASTIWPASGAAAWPRSGRRYAGRSERAVIVVEPSGTVPADVLTDAIRRRIVDLCGLLIHDVVLVRRGMVARTTSGKVQRAATKQRYERGDLEAAAGGQTGLHA